MNGDNLNLAQSPTKTQVEQQIQSQNQIGSQQQAPQSIADLDKMIANTQQKVKVFSWGYIVLSLVFPPFTTAWAFYKANKKGVLSAVLPAMTLAFSIVVLLSAISSISTVSVPTQVSKLGITANTGVSHYQLALFDNLTIFSGLVGLVGGFYFRRKFKKEQTLNNGANWFMIAVIFIQMFLVSYLFYFVYKSAYSNIAPIIQSNYQGIQ